MDIDQLRAFCELAGTGNYRLASERLCITQSALTKKIQRLEEQVGSALFERGRQGARLTPVGETLLEDARRLVGSFGQFKGYARLASEGMCGQLRIGFGVSTYYEAPRYIAGFKQRYPQVSISLNDIPSEVQLRALETGELHLSFNRLPVRAPLQSLLLCQDELVVAVHSGEHVDESALWESLSELNYLKLNPERGPGLSRQIERYLLAHELEPEADQQTDDILTLLALVSARLGYTIIPSSAKRLSQFDIRYIPLTGAHANWEVGLIWNGDKPNPLVERFVASLREQPQFREQR